MLATLKDNRLVRIRAIRPHDKDELAAALAHLSPESVHNRFLSAKPDFSPAELRYLTEVDGWDHVALVASPVDDPEALVERALVRGITRFTATALADNHAVERVIAGIAQRLEHVGHEGATQLLVAELAAA